LDSRFDWFHFLLPPFCNILRWDSTWGFEKIEWGKKLSRTRQKMLFSRLWYIWCRVTVVELASFRPLFWFTFGRPALYNAARESFWGVMGLLLFFLGVYLGGDSDEFVCRAFCISLREAKRMSACMFYVCGQVGLYYSLFLVLF